MIDKILSQLDEDLRVEEKATRGPWFNHRRPHCGQLNCHEIEIREHNGGSLYRSTSYGLMESDGEFIVHTRNTYRPRIRALKQALVIVKMATHASHESGCLGAYNNNMCDCVVSDAKDALEKIQKMVLGEDLNDRH